MKLFEAVEKATIKTLAIIGLAKNAGKTVAFNTIVKEASEKKINLALVSYGRDGEETDILNRHEKPKIFIPPQTIFVTTSGAFEKSDLKASLITNPEIKTTLGDVGIYKTGSIGGNIELVGINSTINLKRIKEIVEKNVDLLIIDGALDRKSSAIPEITEGVILSTGAVLGNNEEVVIKRTLFEIEKINLSEIENAIVKKIIYDNPKEIGFLYKNGQSIFFTSPTTFDVIDELEKLTISEQSFIYLKGPLVDSFAEKLCYSLKAKNCAIVVRDSTHIFLNQRNFNFLKKQNINIFVLNRIKLLSLTINPLSPYGVKLNSEKLVSGFKLFLKDLPVYDLMSKEYSF
jgi:hypothetical protein